MNTLTNAECATITSVTQRLSDKFHRLGLRQTNNDTWTWAGNGCIVSATLQSGQSEAVVRGVWTDGRCTDVTFFDCATSREGVREEETLLFWLNWYMAGNRLTEQGTIGYVAQAA